MTPLEPPSNKASESSGFEWRKGRIIPWYELRFVQDIGGGPGGQHVNKTATRVTLIWQFEQSSAFSDVEKARLGNALAHRLNSAGELRVRLATERSAKRNRDECLQLFAKLLKDSLIVRRRRVATKPSKGSKKRRLEQKTRRSKIKTLRQKPID